MTDQMNAPQKPIDIIRRKRLSGAPLTKLEFLAWEDWFNTGDETGANELAAQEKRIEELETVLKIAENELNAANVGTFSFALQEVRSVLRGTS